MKSDLDTFWPLVLCEISFPEPLERWKSQDSFSNFPKVLLMTFLCRAQKHGGLLFHTSQFCSSPPLFSKLFFPGLTCLYPAWLVLILFQEVSPQSEALFWKRILQVHFKRDSRGKTATSLFYIQDPSVRTWLPAHMQDWIGQNPSQF